MVRRVVTAVAVALAAVGLGAAAALAALGGAAATRLAPGQAAPTTAVEPGRFRPAQLWGADVRSLVVAPWSSDLLLAGTSAGHVYRSDDGGRRWREAGDGLPLRGYVVGTLVFDPNGGHRVWTALWGIWGGGTVAVSEDLGATWAVRGGGLPNEQIYAVAPVPGRPGRLYAAARSGVWGTSDDGASWRLLSAGVAGLVQVASLLVDPYRPQTVIAGTWRRAFRSDDFGLTWRGVFDGMVLDTEVFSLHADPRHAGEVWASTCGWVYQGRDFGARWQRFTAGLSERRTPSFAILFDGRLLAGTVAGLFSSDDRGASWQRRTGTDLSILSIASHPQRPERVWIGTEGAGVWGSTDGGSSFTPAPEGMTNVRVAALTRAGGELVAAVSHAGPGSGIYRSLDGGQTFEPFAEPLPTVLDLAADGARIWAATERGLFVHHAGRPGWLRAEELGAERIEQVESLAGRVVARTRAGLFEVVDGTALRPVPYHHGPPRAMALAEGAIWVSDAESLYRLTTADNHAVATPEPGLRMAPFAGGVLLAGADGVWHRRELADPWLSVHPRGVRLLETGSDRYPLVFAEPGESEGRVWLLAASGGRPLPVVIPVPARDVLAAVIVDDRLMLGTSGYGLLVGPLPDGSPGAGPIPTVAR